MPGALKHKVSHTAGNMYRQSPPGGAVRYVWRLTENPGKAEVAEFDDLVFGDEDVFRLDVAVNALQGHKQSNQIMENSRMCPDACEVLRTKGPVWDSKSRETELSGLHATLLNGGLAAFVVSRWYINCWSARGKEFLLKKSHKADGLVGAGGGRRPKELKNKLRGRTDN